jgi:hypothetical protein
MAFMVATPFENRIVRRKREMCPPLFEAVLEAAFRFWPLREVNDFASRLLKLGALL